MSTLMQTICEEVTDMKRWLISMELGYTEQEKCMQSLKTQLQELPEHLDDMAECIIETVVQKRGNIELPENKDAHVDTDHNVNFNIGTIDEHVNNTLVHMKCMMLEKELAMCRQHDEKRLHNKNLKSDNLDAKCRHQMPVSRAKQRKAKQTPSVALKRIEKKMENIVFG